MKHVQPRNLNLLRALVGPQPEAATSARNLARRTEIHHSFISRILAGERSTISADAATRIASVLGVRPTVLFRPVSSSNAKRAHSKQADVK